MPNNKIPTLLRPKLFTNRSSYLFDGVDECIDIDTIHTALASTTTGTWSFWVRAVDATPAATDDLIAFGDTDASTFIQLKLTTAGLLRLQIVIAGTGQWDLDTDAAAFSDNTWHHVAIVQDGVAGVLYVDGVAPAQAFSVTTDQTVWFNDIAALDNGRIACQNSNSGGNGNFFNGNIDEICFFDTNLTSAQILELYNTGKPKNVLKHSAIGNLVSYFRIDEDTFDGTNYTVRDKKGLNTGTTINNGTTVNMEAGDKENDVP